MVCDDARPPKRRKLKPPGTTSVETAPADDASLHYGRLRAVPHVEGQWATHIYLNIPLNKDLRTRLEDLITEARTLLPAGVQVHSLIESGPLHLSLSRPLQLWTNQRDDFNTTMTSTISKHRPLTLSFAAVTCLTNDEKTRHFLCMEIGYGHAELLSLVQSINGVLAGRKMPAYYAEARFHASIAWWLPEGGGDTALSQESLDRLDGKTLSDLRQFKRDIAEVELKIGKTVCAIPLLEA